MNGSKARIAVLVSGGGTNLQAILDAGNRGEIPHGEVTLVISARAGVRPGAGRESGDSRV